MTNPGEETFDDMLENEDFLEDAANTGNGDVLDPATDETDSDDDAGGDDSESDQEALDLDSADDSDLEEAAMF